MTTGRYAKGDPGRPGRRGPVGGLPVRYVSNRVRIGLHARNDYDFTELDYRIIREAKIETLKTMSHTKVEVYKRVRQESPNLEFIVRLFDDRMGKNHQHPSPADFAARMIPLVQALQPYAVKFEIHNEPNHQSGDEGWGPSLDDAADFNRWFLDVFRLLKTACPWTQLGFPGLALHHPESDFRGDLAWLQACAESVRKADWLGVHCYWQEEYQFSPDWGRWFIEYHNLFPDKMLEMTEFGNSTKQVGRDVVARHYAAYYDMIQSYGLYLRSAAAFLATSPDAGWDDFCWGSPQNNQCYEVVAAVGRLPRTEPVIEAPIDQVAGIVDLRGRLPVRQGPDGKPVLPYYKRDLKGIKYIVIHHSAGSATGTAEGITKWDVTNNEPKKPRWPEASYHFIVEQSGRIVRQHSLDVLAWHAGFEGQPSPADIGINNWEGVAICLIGSFMNGQTPPDAQLRAAARLCQAILAILPQAKIVGHRELGPPKGTECPGDTWLGPEDYKGILYELVYGQPKPQYAFTLTHQTPAKMETGATVRLPVTLRNTGRRTWVATGKNAMRLSYHWADPTGKQYPWEGERTNLPGSVLPDQEVKLDAIVKGPPTAGDYTLQWDMVEELVTWFSQQGVATPQAAVKVTGKPQPIYGYTLAHQLPAAVDSEAALTVPVTLKNTGSKTWLASGDRPIHLSYHWADLSGKVGAFEGERTDLPADVPPSGEVKLQAKVKAPTDPGDYLLQWDMVEEKVTWFSQQAAPVVAAPITVRRAGQQPGKWAVTASVAAAEAIKAADGAPDTAWTTPGPQTSGDWLQVDLGSLQKVSGFQAQSPAGQFARGYVVKVSADGTSWQEVARENDNRADVDVNFAPVKARYVRIELLLPAWAISDVAVQAEPIVVITSKASASHSPGDADKALDGNPATAWSTVAGQTPGAWFQVDLGAAQRLTRITLTSPKKEQAPRGYKVSVSTDGQNWSEIAVKPLNYSNPVEVVPGADHPLPLARHVRIDLTREDPFKNPWSIGELAIKTTPAWTAKASHASDAAGKAIDGDSTTAWSSGAPQAPGIWYELDLGATLKITKVVLEGPEKEFPRGVTVKLSTDGAAWREVGRVERFFKAPAAVSFDPAAGRYIRIEQISDAVQVNNWKIPWTIGEVQVSGWADA